MPPSNFVPSVVAGQIKTAFAIITGLDLDAVGLENSIKLVSWYGSSIADVVAQILIDNGKEIVAETVQNVVARVGGELPITSASQTYAIDIRGSSLGFARNSATEVVGYRSSGEVIDVTLMSNSVAIMLKTGETVDLGKVEYVTLLDGTSLLAHAHPSVADLIYRAMPVWICLTPLSMKLTQA